MTGKPVSDLQGMLAGREPVMLEEHGWQFVTCVGDRTHENAFAVISEAEGTTYIVPADQSDRSPEFARITLQIHSALEGVGLTAAVSNALAEAGIACNVVAGFHHDHLFVPWDRCEEALAILKRLSQDARR